jgi:hypothetical protein
MHHVTLQEFVLYAKVVGEIGSALGVLYGAIRWLRAGLKEVKKTNDNVSLLMENHLPHIQSSLDSHGDALGVLSSDVRNVATKVDGMESRLEDTKTGVKVLGESFLRHLENASRESSPRKKSRRS